jgi:hypothetical protein
LAAGVAYAVTVVVMTPSMPDAAPSA